MTLEIQDKQAETGLKLQNIMTFIVIGLLSWAGLSLEAIKNEISQINIGIAVNIKDIEYNRQGVKQNAENVKLLKKELEDYIRAHGNDR